MYPGLVWTKLIEINALLANNWGSGEIFLDEYLKLFR